jgi:hypothetical protein
VLIEVSESCLSRRGWLTFRGPANDVYCLGVLREGCQVVDLLAVTVLFYLPQLLPY